MPVQYWNRVDSLFRRRALWFSLAQVALINAIEAPTRIGGSMTTASLSTMEMSILTALASGLQSKEIASELDRSRATIEFYIRILFVKMDARSRAHLVARAYEAGLISPRAQVPSQSRV